MSYQIIKAKGNNANVILENVVTKSSVIIGKLTMDIIRVLQEKEGLKFGDTDDDTISLRGEWRFTVGAETGTELARMAMPITKPKRDQSKKKTEQKENKKELTALDIIYGLG